MLWAVSCEAGSRQPKITRNIKTRRAYASLLVQGVLRIVVTVVAVQDLAGAYDSGLLGQVGMRMPVAALCS